MLEAMDGRKQAHTDVLVAVPEQNPLGSDNKPGLFPAPNARWVKKALED
jgi:hypothetical protein